MTRIEGDEKLIGRVLENILTEDYEALSSTQARAAFRKAQCNMTILSGMLDELSDQIVEAMIVYLSSTGKDADREEVIEKYSEIAHNIVRQTVDLYGSIGCLLALTVALKNECSNFMDFMAMVGSKLGELPIARVPTEDIGNRPKVS